MFKKPTLVARFKLDEAGKPRYIVAPGSDLRHYEITLQTEAPDSPASVVYRLDPTFYDPVREVVKEQDRDGFAEDITSYGDFEVEVGTSGSADSAHARIREFLSQALKRGHQTDLKNPVIAAAIDDIEKH